MRFFKKHFTVMVVAGAQARLRRFQIKGLHIAGGTGALVLVLVLAFVTPFLAIWGRNLTRQLAQVQSERDALASRTQQTESAIVELREKLDQFETRTSKLADIAGLELSDVGNRGSGPSTNIANLPPISRAEALNGEADILAERSALLDRRLETVTHAVEAHVERLARIPSILPTQGLLSDGFGWRRDPFSGLRQFHRGLDLQAPPGTKVLAPADGIVVKAERDAGYGNVLYVSHGDGLVTRYGHLSAFRSKPGQKVRRGDWIADVGTTGRSTGPHLHYEVLVGGNQVDPMKYMGDADFLR